MADLHRAQVLSLLLLGRHDLHVVSLHRGVPRDQSEVLALCMSDEHPVERIPGCRAEGSPVPFKVAQKIVGQRVEVVCHGDRTTKRTGHVLT